MGALSEDDLKEAMGYVSTLDAPETPNPEYVGKQAQVLGGCLNQRPHPLLLPNGDRCKELHDVCDNLFTVLIDGAATVGPVWVTEQNRPGCSSPLVRKHSYVRHGLVEAGPVRRPIAEPILCLNRYSDARYPGHESLPRASQQFVGLQDGIHRWRPGDFRLEGKVRVLDQLPVCRIDEGGR